MMPVMQLRSASCAPHQFPLAGVSRPVAAPVNHRRLVRGGAHVTAAAAAEAVTVVSSAPLKVLAAAPAQQLFALAEVTAPVPAGPGAAAPPVAAALDAAADAAGDLSAAAAGAVDAVSNQAEALSGSLAGAASSLTSSVTGVTSGLTSSVTGLTSGLSSSMTDVTSNLTSSVSGAASSLTSSVTGVTSGLTSSVTGLTSGVTAGAGEVAGKLGSTVGDALTKVQGGLGQATQGVSETLTSVKGTFDQTTAGLTSGVTGALESAKASTAAATSAAADTWASTTAQVQGVVDGVTAQVTNTVTQASAAVDATAQQLLDALPPPARDGAVVLGKGLGAAAGAAVAHPLAAGVVVAAVAVPTGVRWYKARYGGFAGELAPQQVLALLSEEDSKAFLVDVRPEEEREEAGTAALKLGARFRVAAFPRQAEVPPRLARLVSNTEELKLLTDAAYIAGLAGVAGPLTRVIIMDGAGGEKARALARALVDIGQPLAYVMEGGFKAWVDAEMPVSESSDYEASVGALLGDEVEILAERAGEVASTLTQPQVGIPLVLGTAAAGVAAVNYHTTLQYIGVWGVLLTLVNQASKYDSPADAVKAALEAVTGVGKSVAGVAGSLGSVKLPSLPNKASGAPSRPTPPTSTTTTTSSSSSSMGLGQTPTMATAAAGAASSSSNGTAAPAAPAAAAAQEVVSRKEEVPAAESKAE